MSPRSESTPQATLLEGLLDPAAYPHPATDIELHETHGAWVLLVGPYAYKLKKPVDFGFFDFSTPELRAADAESEVRLNRRLAPSTYLGIVDVVERDGQIRVGGPGRLLERAVWMRRLPTDGMLPRLLERGEVTPRLVRRIARTIARFHADVPTGAGVDDHGSLATISANWEENFRQIRPFTGRSLSSAQLASIESYITNRLSKNTGLFATRVGQGRIRDGHGDLHAQSICLDGNRLIIFDCIEFAQRYRAADVAAEIAFLAMDLDHNGRPDLGWAYIDEYVRASGDDGLLTLLDFYKCYRAFVRGKVLSFRLDEPGLDPAEHEQIAKEAGSYFDLAAVYAGAMPRPMALLTCGLPGSGKSTLAARVARRLGMLQLSTDVIRKQRLGLQINERAGAKFGTGLYREETTRATYTAMRRTAGRWLRRGVSVILDGSFGSRRERDLARELADRTGAAFFLAETVVTDKVARERIHRRESDPERASDATTEIYQQMRATFASATEVPEDQRYVDETGGGGADELVIRLCTDSDPGRESR